MNEELILKLGQDAIRTTAMLAAPMLIAALVIGLIISVLQAVTQINEATLTFIPKMIVIFVVILIAGPWMLDLISHYTTDLYENIASFVRE
jgi:flagellar biosynthetic protein FliQ